MSDDLNGLIDAIRAALGADASPESKQRGAAACRAILAALDASPGRPLAAPAPYPLASVSPDHLLDAVIARLRALLPTDAAPIEAASGDALRFHLLPLPQRNAGGGQ